MATDARTGGAGGPGAAPSGGPCRWREVGKEIVAAAAALRPRPLLTSSWHAGALLDPSATSAFYSAPGVISDLSAAFRPAELRAGECAPPRLRPYSPGVEAGDSRPCIEMGLARVGRERAGDINRSFVSRFLLSCNTPRAFPPHPQPFLERAETTPALRGPMQVRGARGDSEREQPQATPHHRSASSHPLPACNSAQAWLSALFLEP